MLVQIEVQVTKYDQWITVGLYSVKHIPRIGEKVSVTGNIEAGHYTGTVYSVHHDITNNDVYVQIV